MKRFLIASAAALTLAGPLAATSASAAPFERYSDQRGAHDNDRRDNGNRDNGNRGYDRGNSYNRGNDGRAWNGASHQRQEFRSWRRGERVSAYDQRRFRAVDYRHAHLRAPPRGYRYVQDDRGDTLLLGVATGVILGVILNSAGGY